MPPKGMSCGRAGARPPPPSLSKTSIPGRGAPLPTRLVGRAGLLFFTAGDATRGTKLWKSKGTATSTKRVEDINPGVEGSTPQNLTRIGRILFFNADDGTSGRELWESRGTRRSTRRVKDINPGGELAPAVADEVAGSDDL